MLRSSMVILLSMALLLAGGASRAFAQDQIDDLKAEYLFGSRINFSARLITDSPILNAFIFFQEENSAHTYAQPADISAASAGVYRLSYQADLQSEPLRAFSQLQYRFEVTLQSGEVIRSAPASLAYIDNRFEWQTLEEAPFKVHWIEGEVPFAQTALDAAQAGLERVRSLATLTTQDPIDIYIYANASEMQQALDLAERQWAAGHADPDLNVIMVALPAGPDQQFQTENSIPHELMHVLLYQTLGAGYSALPVWLIEGLASIAELNPNPDYPILLDSAFSRNNLLRIPLLCEGFPADTSNALLAYAQSASFTQYLYRTYGAEGLKRLIAQYSDGLNCETGAREALGKDLTQLERQWRQERFEENAELIALSRLAPWLALLAAVLIIPLLLGIAWLRHKPPKRAGPRATLG